MGYKKEEELSSPTDPEDGKPLDSKVLLEKLRRPPIFVLNLPRPLALPLGVSRVEVRSPMVPVLLVFSLYFIFDDSSLLDALVVVAAAIMVASEGGYKAFAENLQLLTDHSIRYGKLLEEHRQANVALKSAVGDLRETDRKLEMENTALHENVQQLEETSGRLQESVGRLEQESEGLNRMNTQLRETEAALRASAEQQEKANQELQRSAGELRERNDALQRTEEALRGSVAQQEKANQELQTQARGLQERNEALERTERELRDSVVRHEEANTRALDALKKLDASRKKLGGEVQALTQQNEDLCETAEKLRGVLKIAGETTESVEALEKKLFEAVDDLSETNKKMRQNNIEQRRRQLRDIFLKFDLDLDNPGEIDDKDQVRRMAAYVQSVYDTKMEKLQLDLDGDGKVTWEEFKDVLLKDSFWHDEADVSELNAFSH